MNLSPLRSHKWRYNFADTPSEMCSCNQGIEDTSHYLFLCPSYAIERAIPVANVIHILQKNKINNSGNQLQLYLYGHRSINCSDNRNILLSTIQYIKRTLRFSTNLSFVFSYPPPPPSLSLSL